MIEIAENGCITEKTAVALGFFDGLHSGHRLVLSEAKKYAEKGFAPAVFTFNAESLEFKHGKPLEYIYTNFMKLEYLEMLGAKYVYSPDFDEIKAKDGEEFVRDILCRKMNAGAVVCGDNFRFGKNACCGAEELCRFGEKYGFEVRIITLPPDAFSSEKYRNMLRAGKVYELYQSSNAYTLCAEVVDGNHIGRTINFPTINQNFAERQLVPKRGVYHTIALLNGRFYDSVTNIGVKPTVGNCDKPLAETHILGFSGDLYSTFVELTFYRYIREEKKFGSLDELKKQIASDVESVLADSPLNTDFNCDNI